VAWDARGVLRELASPSSASQPLPVLRRAETAPPQQSLTPASATWRDRGFVFEPFAELDPIAPPYHQEPFDNAVRDVAARLARSGTTVIVAGAPGSGRSVLARSVAARTKRGTYVDLDRTSSRSGSLVQRIARAFGAVASPAAGSNAEIEGLLEVLAGAPPSDSVPLIVIDGVVDGTAVAADVALLTRAARSTRYFSLLAVGSTELAAELSAANPASSMVSVLPLTLRQVGAYIDAWLGATRAPDAPPLVVTVDAALLVGRRTDGNLRRINALARRLIAGGSPILTSWDAWVAPDDGGDGGPRPVRPAVWPTPAALQLINQCRAAAGLAERGSAA
jgi:type II secretory pathway predicted ATPase ExeA